MPGKLNDDVLISSGSRKTIPKIPLPIRYPNHMPNCTIWQNILTTERFCKIILPVKLGGQFLGLGNRLMADKAAANVGRCLVV